MESRSAMSVIVAGWLSNMSNTDYLLCWHTARGKTRGGNGAPSTPGRLGYLGRKMLMVLVGLIEPG